MSRKKASTPLLWTEEPATGPDPMPSAVVADVIAKAILPSVPWLILLVTHAQIARMFNWCLAYNTKQWSRTCIITVEDMCDWPHMPPDVATVLREKLSPGWQLWTDFTVVLVKDGESITGRIPVE